MASTSLQVAGLASKFDWKSFVDQIMAIERAPADRLENEKAGNNIKVNLLSTLGSRLETLRNTVGDLKSSAGLFGKRKATLSTSGSSWSASAGANTVSGAYKITVTELATKARHLGGTTLGRKLNPASDDVSGLTISNLPIGQAITAGTFTVNGAQVTVALDDSLQDVFDAISTATGGNVTASYESDTDKITLEAATGNVVLGAANDTSNILRALKLASGTPYTGVVESSARLGALKTTATLANANLDATITAVDGSGNGSFFVNGEEIEYNINTDSLSTIISRINDSDAQVAASYDAATDRMVLTNKKTGDFAITVSEGAGGLMDALKLSSGTPERGKNAEFTLNDGTTLISASNTLDSTSHGVAGLSVTVDSEETQTVTVAADTSAMRAKLEKFVNDFNEVQRFIEGQTRITTDSKGKVTTGPLATNREIQSWAQSLRALAFGAVGGLSGSVARLAHIGLDIKSGTNELEIDDGAALDEALAQSTEDVAEFFEKATTGFAAKFDTFLDNITDLNDEQQERINKTNTSIDEQIATIERQLETRRILMESAFIQMETAQSKINQQQSALDGMLAQKK